MKKLFVILFAILMEIVFAGVANATLITTTFNIEIDSIISSDPNHPYEKSGAAIMSVGDRFYGSVTYDDTNLPNQGSWIIGHSQLYYSEGIPFPGANEYQYWTADSQDPYLYNFFNGSIYGYYDLDHTPPALVFENGKLTGMYVWEDQDQQVIHWNYIKISGTDFTDIGEYYWYDPVTNNSGSGNAYISGTLHIPEPVSILLLGSGLLSLVGFRKKLKKHN